MKIIAYEGPAGTGKTTRLIQSLEALLTTEPLHDGQRVLALTYMHGSRRRLHDRLSKLLVLRGRFQCNTFDSFAFMVCNRWKSLLSRIGLPVPGERAFDQTCDCCGALMEQGVPRSWVAAGFPRIVIDEAQDLNPQRLRILRGLAAESTILIAADEFQCLDDRLRPNPAVEWLQTVATPEPLSSIYRTNQQDLIEAASAIRRGANVAIRSRKFNVFAAPSEVLAATYISNAIAWEKTGSVAILTPSCEGGFTEAIVSIVTKRRLGKTQNGPFSCHWESTDGDEASTTMRTLALPETLIHQDLLSHIDNLKGGFPGPAIGEWADKSRSLSGKIIFGRADVERQVTRLFSLRRHYSSPGKCNRVAMTVHQAKNREFDGVVVIWPYTIAGDAERKRRLLYNAVTRAKHWCLVLTQSEDMLAAPPFKDAGPVQRQTQLDLGLLGNN